MPTPLLATVKKLRYIAQRREFDMSDPTASGVATMRSSQGYEVLTTSTMVYPRQRSVLTEQLKSLYTQRPDWILHPSWSKIMVVAIRLQQFF